MIQPEDCEILYHFFRTGAEYITGYRSSAPYPDSAVYAAFSEKALAAERGIPAETESCSSAQMAAFACIDNPSAAMPNRSSGVQTGTAEPYLSGDAPLGSLQAVYAAVGQCAACKLAATRIKPVPGEGPEELSRLSNSVDVMVIGEGPGADEDRQGRPFVGKAGQLLDKMLEAIQLSRKTNCYITNVVKCRPPHNRDPEPDERSCCAAFLEAQIRLTHPKMILVMGRVAAQHLLQTSDGIGKLRGRFFDYCGIPLMPTYHPSALLRDESLKRPAWEDLKRFRARLQALQGRG